MKLRIPIATLNTSCWPLVGGCMSRFPGLFPLAGLAGVLLFLLLITMMKNRSLSRQVAELAAGEETGDGEE